MAFHLLEFVIPPNAMFVDRCASHISKKIECPFFVKALISHARAKVHQRLAVAREIPIASAASSL